MGYIKNAYDEVILPNFFQNKLFVDELLMYLGAWIV